MSQSSNATRGLALEVAELAKSFEAKRVLEAVSLAVRPSEFVAVVGKSGCGKSTLLRLIAGLDRPSRGSIAIDGTPLSGVNPSVRVVFQDHRLLAWKRVVENVAFGRSSEGGKQDALTLLEGVGLGDRANDMPGNLSGGEKQRVSLARALFSRPGLLLLDEPLGALDALTRISMQGLLERLWLEQGFTALLITHDVDEAIVLADRVVVLKDGIIDCEVEVDLPRPRPRTGPAFDRIKELVLDRILRDASPSFPNESRKTQWHAHPKTDSTSEPSSPRAPAPEPSARGAIPLPNSTASSRPSTTSTSPARWSGASST
jgi:sulfonate transport system ATP-binding protein